MGVRDSPPAPARCAPAGAPPSGRSHVAGRVRRSRRRRRRRRGGPARSGFEARDPVVGLSLVRSTRRAAPAHPGRSVRRPGRNDPAQATRGRSGAAAPRPGPPPQADVEGGCNGVTDRDAYRDDMSFLHPLDIDEPDLGPAVEEIRSLFRRSPSRAVETRHLAAMAEHAEAAPAVLGVERSPVGRPIRLIARLGVVAAVFGLLTGGLALAGVDLPVFSDRSSDKAKDAGAEEADDVSDSLSDTAQRVQAVIETNLPLLHEGQISGCEFGAMVSAAARDVEPDTSKCQGETDDGSQGSEASAKGKARAEEAKAAGQAKGEEASGGKANAGGN